MKNVIRRWIGGHDYHEENGDCSSYCGVLSYRGIPVGFCYYSYVTQRRHYILSNTCDARVTRYLKNRNYIQCNNFMNMIASFRGKPLIDTITNVVNYVRNFNSTLHKVGAPPKFILGDMLIPPSLMTWWGNDSNYVYRNELTFILYRARKKSMFFLAKPLHSKDEHIRDAGWRYIGMGWFTTRNQSDFVLFKLGNVGSIAVEINLEDIQHSDPMPSLSDWSSY